MNCFSIFYYLEISINLFKKFEKRPISLTYSFLYSKTFLYTTNCHTINIILSQHI